MMPQFSSPRFLTVCFLKSMDAYHPPRLLLLLLLLLSRFSRVHLWDPIDGSPPGSPIPGILQARILAAKSPQSCLTLCDLIDSSPPGSPIPGILQARTLEWVAISFSNA